MQSQQISVIFNSELIFVKQSTCRSYLMNKAISRYSPCVWFDKQWNKNRIVKSFRRTNILSSGKTHSHGFHHTLKEVCRLQTPVACSYSGLSERVTPRIMQTKFPGYEKVTHHTPKRYSLKYSQLHVMEMLAILFQRKGYKLGE